MSALQLLVGVVLPFVAVLVFVVGMAYRFRVWFKTPQPAKMTLTQAPKGSLAGAVIAETMFLPSLFKGDWELWPLY